MKIGRGRQCAVAVLLLGVIVSVGGCPWCPCGNQALWQNDFKHARLLVKVMTGPTGYYAKDTTMSQDERTRLAKDLLDLEATFSGPAQPAQQRRDMEAKLRVHVDTYREYVDKDAGLTPEEKKIRKDAFEKWLKRVSEGR